LLALPVWYKLICGSPLRRCGTNRAAYQVRIENFEGPLDLLLHLIKKSEINIYDIPIHLIAQQYLTYIEAMEELNLTVAGEFLVMAATLLQIKSKMLLPADETFR